MIKLDMLSHITFGQREYVDQLLDGALEDILVAKQTLTDARTLKHEELWKQLHNLKATLSMLQAGHQVQTCQTLLNHMEKTSVDMLYDDIHRFTIQLTEVEIAIQNEKSGQ